MIQKTRVMLYVNDVDTNSDFWKKNLQAQDVGTTQLAEGFKNITLALSDQFELSLFPKEFVEKYSPEVMGPVPSLMFFSDDFDQLHTTLPNAGDIQTIEGVKTFNFTDPEDNYFVIAQEESK